jgi:hypothetical protein
VLDHKSKKLNVVEFGQDYTIHQSMHRVETKSKLLFKFVIGEVEAVTHDIFSFVIHCGSLSIP